ncbi:MAG TPA: TerD family protein [Candidatus Saccharimonadales bacterium]|nr:TerD family protein [Candidatus Saccharimonadales bacterium]
MSTWWQSVTRADIGLADIKFGSADFSVTNRGWYVLYKILRQMDARSYEHAAKKGQQYVPQSVVEDWANRLAALGSDDWLQVSAWNGTALQFHCVVHRQEARRYTNDYELTPLLLTPVGMWLQQIANNLVSAGSGIAISGKPRKGHSMSVSLQKGGNVNLTKEAGGTLTNVVVGLGWDARATTGQAYDVDASAIAAKDDGKVLSDGHFVFYGNLKSADGSIQHTGDNLTGDGDGDDEQIKVNLAAVPAEIEKIVFPVSIHEAAERKQNFGQIRNAFVRVVDATTGKELSRYDLSEDAATETVMVFGELYRHGSDWKFRAIGDGYANGLGGLAKDYGVNIGG